LKSVADVPSSSASQRVHVLATLADALIAAGNLDEAKQVLERADNSAEGFKNLMVLVHVRMATVEERLGNIHQAEWERNYARGLQTGP
jgi:hypothetical protein